MILREYLNQRNMKPILFILAAGMGSRYGGLKQLDSVGPNGETIMDYSVYDAISVGFGKIVFAIRHSFEEAFREKIVSKYRGLIKVELVYQELEYLPDGYTLNEDREKPWGTNHALLMGKEVIKEPFAIINADDFYGRESYRILAKALSLMKLETKSYCMIGYKLGNTLSDSGSVARGVCEVDNYNNLVHIDERTAIERKDDVPAYKDADGEWQMLTDNTPVSMNMWGFTPDYFDLSETEFVNFLDENKNNLKAEFLIPTVVDKLLKEKKLTVKLLTTPSKWFGVTYAKDKPEVMAEIKKLIEFGIYPEKLF